jgi:hypothetical protein
MLTPVIVKAALPVLLRVTTLAGLVVPTAWFVNTRLAGERLTAGAMPVPIIGTLCGLPPALSEMLIPALRVPEAVGAKIALIEQEAPAAMELLQVLV